MAIPQKPLLIVEGNIGVGKSTFLHLIGDALNAQLVYEPLQKWQNVSGDNLLDRFYHDTQRWAYTFQSYAFITRIMDQSNYAEVNTKPFQILERSVYSDRYCFAKNCYELGYMDTLEWKLYQELFSWLAEGYTQRPDAFIYLQADPEVCYSRILKRSRSEEANVSLDYLKLLHNKHEEWLIHRKDISPHIRSTTVLTLSCNEDFENNKELQSKHITTIAHFLNTKFALPNNLILAQPKEQQHYFEK